MLEELPNTNTPSAMKHKLFGILGREALGKLLDFFKFEVYKISKELKIECIEAIYSDCKENKEFENLEKIEIYFEKLKKIEIPKLSKITS